MLLQIVVKGDCYNGFGERTCITNIIGGQNKCGNRSAMQLLRSASLIAHPHNDVTTSSATSPHVDQASFPLSTLFSARQYTMSDYAFRKIDIDALDEDVLLPSDLYDPDPRGPDGVLEDAKRRSSEVRGLVSR